MTADERFARSLAPCQQHKYSLEPTLNASRQWTVVAILEFHRGKSDKAWYRERHVQRDTDSSGIIFAKWSCGVAVLKRKSKQAAWMCKNFGWSGRLWNGQAAGLYLREGDEDVWCNTNWWNNDKIRGCSAKNSTTTIRNECTETRSHLKITCILWPYLKPFDVQ